MPGRKGLSRGLFFVFFAFYVVIPLPAAEPVVSNVRASQRSGTQLVDVYYDLAHPESSALAVSVMVSTNGGGGWFSPGASVSGALVSAGASTADSGPSCPQVSELKRKERSSWDGAREERQVETQNQPRKPMPPAPTTPVLCVLCVLCG
jgi:hypothetical protein